MSRQPFCIVTAWHNEDQRDKFISAWNLPSLGYAGGPPDWLVLQQDKNKEGCAVTKNKGIARARELNPEVIIVLDDDCYPHQNYSRGEITLTVGSRPLGSLEEFAQHHIEALQPQDVELFEAVTDPPSRGTPYFNRTVKMPVAASMGFWTENPDYDAPMELSQRREPWNPTPIKYHRKTMFWRYFALSGMNLALPRAWAEKFRFVDVPRFDDIWAGIAFERLAYAAGHCINLNGPMVRHVRQSNVWNNLRVEAENLEKNETYWKELAGFS